ncbi:DoxX family protein [Candidatus Mycobacterium wuenschmannii]|uniref:DoxX family protein n=1 Tax=Candidatus Mycobacterium wuenschmannii TaxID=3027808 RepID=A0ABY8W176_9MYCO|nr:DoxX family protein [Candidatus Mycobacterium wuenschmannii]WIM89111.1 DoxX family protein [Candidatus Mycobacterium wuenschmannii]
MLIRRIARPLLSAAFIGQGVEALRNPAVTLEATEPTVAALRQLPEPYGDKVPSNPETAARINAAVQVAGGVLLATGKAPRIASAALAFTVIPGSLGGHLFWTESDPQRKAQKRRDLLTDLSLLGGLIIAAADTAGKPSLGWRGRQAAERLSSALPLTGSDDSLLDSELAERIAQGLHAGAERSRELASAAAERSAPVVEAARKRGEELAHDAAKKSKPVVKKARKKARKRGAELAETVRERGADLAETARDRGSEWAHDAAKKSKPVVKKARKRGAELADVARDRGSEWADIAWDRGSEWAEIARDRGSELSERAYERGSELAELARDRGEELAHRGRATARHWH